MATRQALGIDVSHWSRTGGINYELVKEHIRNGVYDFLIIKVGQGTWQSNLFNEQKENAEQHGIPYTTYHFLDPAEDMRQQARNYVDWVGTNQASYIIDVEKPYGGDRPPNITELQNNIGELIRLTGKRPVVYSRIDVLRRIGFLGEARQYHLWLAQYLWDLAHYPEEHVQYRYFHDFIRDHAWDLPPSVRNTGLEEKVILWQFSEKGKGPHYIFNRRTDDPRFPIGKKSADLNASLIARDEFLELMIGEVVENGNGNGPENGDQPTYKGLTNQDMINITYQAAGPFTDDPWNDWIVPAGLRYLAVPPGNRDKLYTGPKIEALPSLSQAAKDAILAVMNAQDGGAQPDQPTYPGKINQDIINAFHRAASAFSVHFWDDWVKPAGLEYLAVPSENRGKPYTGPKIEDLPGLTEDEKNAILAVM